MSSTHNIFPERMQYPAKDLTRGTIRLRSPTPSCKSHSLFSSKTFPLSIVALVLRTASSVSSIVLCKTKTVTIHSRGFHLISLTNKSRKVLISWPLSLWINAHCSSGNSFMRKQTSRQELRHENDPRLKPSV